MIVKLLTEHHLEFLSLKGGAQARPSLHLSKCHIVGNHKTRRFVGNHKTRRSNLLSIQRRPKQLFNSGNLALSEDHKNTLERTCGCDKPR